MNAHAPGDFGSELSALSTNTQTDTANFNGARDASTQTIFGRKRVKSIDCKIEKSTSSASNGAASA
jgi:hypothetical protein